MRERDITNQARARAFLAQVLHESAGLNFFEEIASGAAYEGRRDLGNTQPGDGKRFKGRGPIQLTGRSNYRRYGDLLKLPLESNPEMAARHDIGWRIAAAFWETHGLNALADQGNLREITRRINGGFNGWDDRLRRWELIGRIDARPSDEFRGYTESEERWIKEYDKLKRENRDIDRRRVLRRVMKEQRQRIWRVAQPKSRGGDGRGWDHQNRRGRYESLKARSD
jgi:predicted chitinase